MKPGVTPLNQRVQVDSQIQDGNLDVTASPVSTVGRSQDADRKAAQLFQSLGEFTGAFDQFAKVKTNELAQDEQQKALMDHIARAGAEPVLTGEQSAWYQEESMKLFGQTQTTQALTELNQQIEEAKADPEKMRSLDPTKFMTEWVASHTQGLKDPLVAEAVYGTLQKVLPSKVDELATAKRSQLAADVKQKQKDSLDAAASYANGQFKDGTTSQGFWGTFDSLVATGMKEKDAMKVVAQAAKNAGVASVMENRNPRNGWSVFQYLGDDEASQNEITASIRFEKNEKERKQKEADDEAEKAQKWGYNQWKGDLKDRQVQGYRLTPDDFMKLEPEDRASFREHQIAEDTKKAVEGEYERGVLTVGADNMDGSKEKKQEVFDKSARQLLQTAPFDPKDPSKWTAGAQKVLTLKATGNTSMSLSVLKNQVNEAWQDAPPEGANGAVGLKTQKAFEVYKMVKANPSYAGWESELFDEKTLAYLKAIDQNHTVDGNSLTQSVTYAKTAVSEENVAVSKRWLSDKGRKNTEAAVIKELEGSVNLFAEYTDSTHQMVSEMLGPWLETAALTVRDPRVLAKQFGDYLKKNTVRVEDPDSWKVARFGVNKDRLVPIPKDDNGSVGFGERQGKTPLTGQDISNGSYARAIELAEKQMNEAWNKGTGSAKYRLVPDWQNPAQFNIYKDGVPMPMMKFPATLAWDAFTAAGGKSPLVGSVKYQPKDEAAMRALMEAQFNQQYGKLEGSRKASLAVTDVAPIEMPKKVSAKPGDPGQSVAYSPFVVPKGVKGLPPPPPVLPPATMPGGVAIPPIPKELQGKLPQWVPPKS